MTFRMTWVFVRLSASENFWLWCDLQDDQGLPAFSSSRKRPKVALSYKEYDIFSSPSLFAVLLTQVITKPVRIDVKFQKIHETRKTRHPGRSGGITVCWLQFERYTGSDSFLFLLTIQQIFNFIPRPRRKKPITLVHPRIETCLHAPVPYYIYICISDAKKPPGQSVPDGNIYTRFFIIPGNIFFNTSPITKTGRELFPTLYKFNWIYSIYPGHTCAKVRNYIAVRDKNHYRIPFTLLPVPPSDGQPPPVPFGRIRIYIILTLMKIHYILYPERNLRFLGQPVGGAAVYAISQRMCRMCAPSGRPGTHLT